MKNGLFEVGDRIEFEAIGIFTPRWDYAKDMLPRNRSEGWFEGTVTETDGTDNDFGVEYLGLDGYRYHWFFPQVGHPKYAPNREGWVRLRSSQFCVNRPLPSDSSVEHIKVTLSVTVRECGADKCKLPFHSTWCPKHQ